MKKVSNDWVFYTIEAIVFILTIIGNYFYHGGHIVW